MTCIKKYVRQREIRMALADQVKGGQLPLIMHFRPSIAIIEYSQISMQISLCYKKTIYIHKARTTCDTFKV